MKSKDLSEKGKSILQIVALLLRMKHTMLVHGPLILHSTMVYNVFEQRKLVDVFYNWNKWVGKHCVIRYKFAFLFCIGCYFFVKVFLWN